MIKQRQQGLYFLPPFVTLTDVDRLMLPVSRFGGGDYDKKKQIIIEKLKAFFEKYFGLISFNDKILENNDN